MRRLSAILAGILLATPGSAFAAGVHVRSSVPITRSNPAAVGIAAAYARAGQSVGFGSVPLSSLMGANFLNLDHPTLASVYLAVRAYTLKLRANVVRTFNVGNVDTAVYMPTGEVARALQTLRMPAHERTAPKSIRVIKRRRASAMRPASDTGSSYLAEGISASSVRGQLSRMSRRQQALVDKIDPSGVGRRIEGAVSFDGGRTQGVFLN